jgi:hypothetical protein
LPDPLDPAVTVIHEALLTAVQMQPVPAVTVTVLEEAVELIAWLVGVRP